jgi:diguanylate cyclase (GGDEF)-like protein/PAS domain S-box-containing protein
MPGRRVRLLLVEDRVSDAELVLHELRRAGLDPDWVRVDDEPAFRANLNAGVELVLADFNLPQFDAIKALAILKESGLDIPFIIVSGTIGDAAAVDSMRGGAQDYILKDNLSRLAAAATRELEAADQRKAGVRTREESATRLAAIIRSALDAVVSMDEHGRILGWNPQAEALFGWTADEALGRRLAETIIPPAARAAHTAGLARYLATGEAHILHRRIEVAAMHRDGREFPVEVSIAPLSVGGRPSFSGFIRDITDRKRAEKTTNVHLAVSQALAEPGTLDTVLTKVLEAVGRNLGWDVGQVWLRDPADGALHCAHRWLGAGARASEFDGESAAARFAPGDGMVGRVWLDRQSVWLDDLSQAPDARLGEAAGRAGLTSAVFAPLFAGTEVNGVVQFFSHARRPADPTLVQLMSDLSGRMGEFISRTQSAAALRESESRFRGLFYDVAVGQALIRLPEARVLAANPAFCRLLGYAQDELLGQSAGIIADPARGFAAREALAALSITSPSFQVEARLVRKDGGAVWASLSVLATFDDAGKPRNLLLQAQDITQRHEAERSLADAQLQLRHRAGHDALTELPNRTQLQERLQEVIRGAEDHVALLVLNLDHFKDVNDSFGHVAGDELLKQLGPRIQASFRREDLVARLGGDEFGVILAGTEPAIAGQLAEKLSASLQQPFTVQGQALAVEASIGIATYPEHGTTAEELMRRADIALHVAKRAPGTAAIYSPEYEGEGASHLTLMADLRAAIQDNSLSVYYQPLVDLKSGLVVRFEALLRWKHAVRGMVPPDQFIPFAEKTGVIQPLTDWVLRNVLHQTQAWHEAGHDLGVAVNISMRNLMDPGLPERIALLLEEFPAASRGGVPLLSLEVTEGVVMADPKRAVERLSRLRRLGIRLSVDDFGTGYSSLAYLSRLPINEMKIDRSFISGIADDPNKAAVVRAALDLGHNLRLEVVAEGVEDRRTWDLLFVLGCDTAQGYHMCRPMPAEAVIPWLLSSPYGGVVKADQAA